MGRRRWHVVTSPIGTFSSAAHLEVVYPMLRMGLLSQTVDLCLPVTHWPLTLGRLAALGLSFTVYERGMQQVSCKD